MKRPRWLKAVKSRAAVSAVISNMILLAAVIAAGFAALAWTMSNANSYVTQYGASSGSSINQLRESIAFEYVFYNSTSKNLTAYILNYGKINGVSIAAAYISDQGTRVYSKINGVPLYILGTTKTYSQGLNIGQEGYFVLSLNSVAPPVTLQNGKSYMIQISTGRGSYFENMFTA